MKGLFSIKNIVIGIIAIVLIIVLYSALQGKDDVPRSSSGLSSTSGVSPTQSVVVGNNARQNNELLALLNSIETLSLDDSIFSNPVFVQLRSIAITLPAVQSKGRANPFAPIGVGQQVTSVTVTSSGDTEGEDGSGEFTEGTESETSGIPNGGGATTNDLP